MRNGNIQLLFFQGNSKFVLILPMRNGNLKNSRECSRISNSSYPTYEEWKLSLKSLLLRHPLSSYPTYEEWKPSQATAIALCWISVLILPMRNGN